MGMKRRKRHMSHCASQLCQGFATLSELDVFFELYPPKLGEEIFQGSGGSALTAGGGMYVMEPSAPPKERPADSGGGYKLSCGREVDPYVPNGFGRGVFKDSLPNELKGFASNGVTRSVSAGQNDPSLLPKVRGGGAWNVCVADGVFSLDDVRSSSSISAFISFSDIERESVLERSVREELALVVLVRLWDCSGDRGIEGNGDEGSSGISGGADSERCVGGGMDGTWK